MNPFILGLFRAQRMAAAERAAAIRMDMAADTGYLNPQAGMQRLSGLPAYATGYGAEYVPVQTAPLPVNLPQTSFGPEAYQAYADYRKRQAVGQVFSQPAVLNAAYAAFASGFRPY